MKKILVVDDSPFFIRTIEDMLAKEGHQVTTAESGTAAIECLDTASLSSPFDLLITDLVMPEMDGYELAQHVREKNRGRKFLPVIMLTEKEITKEEARKHGCSAYIPKSDLNRLVSTSRALLKTFS